MRIGGSGSSAERIPRVLPALPAGDGQRGQRRSSDNTASTDSSTEVVISYRVDVIGKGQSPADAYSYASLPRQAQRALNAYQNTVNLPEQFGVEVMGLDLRA